MNNEKDSLESIATNLIRKICSWVTFFFLLKENGNGTSDVHSFLSPCFFPFLFIYKQKGGNVGRQRQQTKHLKP